MPMTTIILFGIASFVLFIVFSTTISAWSTLIQMNREPHSMLGFILFLIALFFWLLNIYLAVNTF